MPRLPKINKRALTHCIEWTQKKLTSNPDSKIIDNVFIDIGFVVDKEGSQESSYANYWLIWDDRWSTKINGEIPKFSVGDSVRIIRGPINQYPKLLKIINVWQFPDIDGHSCHHIEMQLR